MLEDPPRHQNHHIRHFNRMVLVQQKCLSLNKNVYSYKTPKHSGNEHAKTKSPRTISSFGNRGPKHPKTDYQYPPTGGFWKNTPKPPETLGGPGSFWNLFKFFEPNRPPMPSPPRCFSSARSARSAERKAADETPADGGTMLTFFYKKNLFFLWLFGVFPWVFYMFLFFVQGFQGKCGFSVVVWCLHQRYSKTIDHTWTFCRKM